MGTGMCLYLESRLIYDNGEDLLPPDLLVDFTEVNRVIDEWREKSLEFINTALNQNSAI